MARGDMRVIRRALTCSVLLAAVAGPASPPAPAAAQMGGDIPYVDAVDAWANAESLRRLLPGSRDGRTGTTKSSQPRRGGQLPKKPTARQLATLRFERSDQVTGQAYKEVFELLEPGYDRAAIAAEFDRVKALIRKDMRQLKGGWSPNNLGDVAGYLLVNCYAAFYSRTSLPDPGVQAVRRAARRDLASKRQIRRLSDTRKQMAVEMLELRTIIRISDLNRGRKERDPARERSAKNELRSWIRQAFGVDLKKVKLTRDGLLRR